MRTSLARIVFMASLCLAALPGQAATIELIPSSLTVSAGDLVDVAVHIAGLGEGVAPSVGAFDLSVAFDASILAPLDVTFGPFLGDPSLFETLTDFTFTTPGIVNLAEVSLLSPTELDALQPASFELATLLFTTIAPGHSGLFFTDIRVDDAFGAKIETVPVAEPSSVSLVGLCLVGIAGRGYRAAKRWRARAVVFGCLCLAPGLAHADKVVSRTIAPIKDVSGTCALETKEADQSLSFTCAFTNKTGAAVRFLFCAMVDLTDAKKMSFDVFDGRQFKPIDAATDFVLKQMGGNDGKLFCERVKARTADPSSVYFGCVEVTLAAGAKDQSVSVGSVAGYKLVTRNRVGQGDEKEVPFRTLKAADFTVVYTDQVNLTATPKKTFDKDSCKGASGQGNFIFYDEQTIATAIRSQWAFSKKSLVDPFLLFQPLAPVAVPLTCDANADGVVEMSDVQAIFAARNRIVSRGDPRDADPDGRITVNDARVCTLRITRQYTTYNDPPCLPTGFPAKVMHLPACALRNNPAPPTTVDLNLFNWYTEIEPADERIPTVLAVTATGDLSGLRVETTPPAGVVFDMLGGGVELIGKLTVCSSESAHTCLTPRVPEGQQIEVTVDMIPLNPDDPFVFESGQFVQDTEPPGVLSHAAGFDLSGNLIVDVTAIDVTTSPIHAELWFSSDAGMTWANRPLESTSNILAEIPTQTRTFQGSAGPFVAGQPVRYFIAVQDEVSNIVFFGVGKVTPF